MSDRDKQKVSLPTMEQVEEERKRIRYKNTYRKTLFGTVDILVFVAAVSVLISVLFLPVMQISGNSMEPTLCNDDIIVLVKTNKFKTGDLCSFSWNNRTLIKRIIGVPGDWIEMDHEGNVYVNGQKLDEPYVTEKSLFMMGDHRETSIDSRNTLIGSVNYDQVIGKVLFRIWPLK